MTEYLIRDDAGRWEICRPGVFKNESGYVVAWANRRGEYFCSNDDVVDVRPLEE